VTGWVFTVENFHLLLHTGFNRRFGRLPHKVSSLKPPGFPNSAEGVRGTLSAEAPDMEHYNLSLGAHLLLWVFPLVLVILVFVENFLDGPAAKRQR